MGALHFTFSDLGQVMFSMTESPIGGMIMLSTISVSEELGTVATVSLQHRISCTETVSNY